MSRILPTSEQILSVTPIFPPVPQVIVEVMLSGEKESGYEVNVIPIFALECRLVRTYCADKWPGTESPDHLSMVEAGWTWEGDYPDWVPLYMDDGCLVAYDNAPFEIDRAWGVMPVTTDSSTLSRMAEDLYTSILRIKEYNDDDSEI